VTGQPLEFRGLTKRFGAVEAVTDLTLTIAPGRVTGFLGPNGAGKTTSLRCALGLVAPTSGEVLIGGRRYAELDHPLHVVGAVLESASFHPGRSARNHLRWVAHAAGLPGERVQQMLEQVGMDEYADRRVGGFSLGMRQRLGLAQALLGDPGVLVLDEPANGLDPAGIAWLRGFLRSLAAQGRTVLVSSHVLGEVQQTVDDVVVVSRGRLVAHGALSEMESAQGAVVVRGPERDQLAAALASDLPEAGEPEQLDADGLRVRGVTTAEVGRVAHRHGLELHELSTSAADLERLFLDLTGTAA
jgi:ABC-2 type transport system ATP-binding protein